MGSPWAINSAPFSLVFLLDCPLEARVSEKGSHLALPGDCHEFSWGDIWCSALGAHSTSHHLHGGSTMEAILPKSTLKPSNEVKHMLSKVKWVLSQLIPKVPWSYNGSLLTCACGWQAQVAQTLCGLTWLF